MAQVTATARRASPRRGRRSWEVRSLVYLFLGGAVGATTAAVHPLGPGVNVALVSTLALGCLVLAIVLHLAGDGLRRWVQQASLASIAVFIGAGVVASASLGGAMVSGYVSFWVAIYAAHFLPRRHALAHACFLSATFGLALHLRGYPVLLPWAIVTASLVTATLLLSGLARRIQEQATTDQLTGLLNRHGLHNIAAREFAVAERTGWPVTLAVFDLDDFKVVNDQGGHAAGDALLRWLADSWRERVRPGDAVGRLGGDEFVVLLPRATPGEAAAVLERLAAASPITWSSGMTQWRPGDDLDTCIQRADRVLYEDKRGRAASHATRAAGVHRLDLRSAPSRAPKHPAGGYDISGLR